MSLFDAFFKIDDDNDYSLNGLNNELFSIYIYNTFIQKDKSILVVTGSTYSANLLYQSLLNYSDKVFFFPMDDFLTSEAIAISPEFMLERINTLNSVLNLKKCIVVTNLMGALRYLPVPELWKKSKITLKVGDEIERDKLINVINKLGYERETIVNGTGKYGVRGFVLDIFPSLSDNAIRIEFWGDTIDSIKYFDIDSQLSLSNVNEVTIYPFTEFILEKYSEDVIFKQKYLAHYSKNVSSICDYLNQPIVFFYDYKTIINSYDLLFQTITDYDKENPPLVETKYMNDFAVITGSQKIFYNHFDDDVIDNKHIYSYRSIDKYNGDYNLIKRDLLKFINDGLTVILCIPNKDSAKRIVKYLDIDDIVLTKVDQIIRGKINLINANVYEGFIFNEYAVLGLNDIFSNNYEIVRYRNKYRIGKHVQNLNDLALGDYVVHDLFGIGIYRGLHTLTKNGMQKDYLKIEYAGGDFLYIPVENVDCISKYAGREGLAIKLNSLSNDSWQRKKSKVKEKLESIAADLLKVSVDREANLGFAFAKDTEEQMIFENEFVYTETEDQIKATQMIKTEMEKDRPMDMLLCGDVGYGKTEVAFRAMFKAVLSGKQVAYLCPTTILSIQQYEAAKARFATFPVNIEVINRFVDKSKQKKIISDLALGKIDIIFGTHRLLSNDIVYKDLGLLVVDEEQRFGVTHKEKIKSIKTNVDVLTLSATPIPRTLYMSLGGIRKLALIETPPKERYPIQTYVMEESDVVIKDAIYKELSRDGQVFILFNNIDKIIEKVDHIKKMVPEAKIDYAHGKMTKDALEGKMHDFINHKFNILVCTTIIETGIDIPNVNTLIILDADRFGLSQLYQIRGRIGRSNKIGYAYLMYSKSKFLNDIAIKRLDTIKEFTQLGSGYKIAMRDLAIRGAGDILGREQSGNIDSIGIDLYLKMLNEAVVKAKNGGDTPSLEVPVKNDRPLISVATHISDDYVDETELKLLIHRRINMVDSYDSFVKIKEELEDRFGKMDDTLIVYMYEEWFEKLARLLCITSVLDNDKLVDITLPEDLSNQINGEDLFYDVYEINHNFKLNYTNKKIHIILEKNKLEKHYLMYLIAVLIKIKSKIKK